jgi:hypothetical protein
VEQQAEQTNSLKINSWYQLQLGLMIQLQNGSAT